MATSQPPEDRTPHPAERQAVAAVPLAAAAPNVAVSKTNETAAAGLAARARAEIETRAIMAWRRLRDVVAFRQRMVDACTRIAFADAAMWERPVGSGKTTSGLSIRFAEECARNYTNLDISIVVVSEDDEHRVNAARLIDSCNPPLGMASTFATPASRYGRNSPMKASTLPTFCCAPWAMRGMLAIIAACHSGSDTDATRDAHLSCDAVTRCNHRFLAAAAFVPGATCTAFTPSVICCPAADNRSFHFCAACCGVTEAIGITLFRCPVAVSDLAGRE